MKKLLLPLLLSGLCNSALNAQLVLTQSNNEPIAGDVLAQQRYDSVIALPRNMGQNQTWNFSSITQSTFTSASSKTYVPVSSVPASSLFPAANLAAQIGPNQYEFYTSVASPTPQFEFIGNSFPGRTDAYSDTWITNTWPTSYGSLTSDYFAGTITGPVTAQLNGTVNAMAVGTGTLILPGGFQLSNVLQVKSISYSVETVTAPTPTSSNSFTTTIYDYYHASSKFPVVTIFSQKSTFSAVVPDYTWVFYNKPLGLGILEKSSEFDIGLYPNPASGNFTISISNAKNENCTMGVYDAAGKTVLAKEAGNASLIKESLSVTALPAGVYLVKVQLGEQTSYKKLAVQ